jgi:hypothetical protein
VASEVFFMTSGIDTITFALLQHKRIYFGHQSVGANIMEGVRDLGGHDMPRLNIIDSGQPDAIVAPAFAHSAIGQNQNPRSKVEAFADILNHGLGNKADIAFMKFCYIDVTEGTDITGLYEYYRRVMTELITAYPKTRFLHVTVPLTVMPTFLRRTFGHLRGKRNRTAYDNLARADYNRLLRAAYAGKEPVFDLATVESTTPSGRTLHYSLDGRTLQTLVPTYSSDGRHLSVAGRQTVATALLKTLATVAVAQRAPTHG